MKQLHSMDVIKTFEISDVPLIVEFLIARYYFPKGSLLLYEKGRLREHVFSAVLKRLETDGVDLYKTDVQIRQASESFRTSTTALRLLCDTSLQSDRLTQDQMEEILQKVGECFAAYERFDVWYTEGGYRHRSDPAVKNALEFAGREKNEMRGVIGEILFQKGKYFLATLERLAQDSDVPFDEITAYLPEEVLALFRRTRISSDRIMERRSAFVLLCDIDGTETKLEGQAARDYIKNFDKKDDSVDLFEVHGQSANGGPLVRGRVCIISTDYDDFSRTQRKMDAMQEGDVLVAPTTAPDLMPAFFKAAAVVTDVGGMLSHAAITSRELGKPCIVGTQTASSLLKDGDMVEVDTDNGIVRRI